ALQRAARTNKSVLDQSIHERRVLGPRFLLLERPPMLPCRPASANHRKELPHGKKDDAAGELDSSIEFVLALPLLRIGMSTKDCHPARSDGSAPPDAFGMTPVRLQEVRQPRIDR